MASGPQLSRRPKASSRWPKCEHCGARRQPDPDPIADLLATKLKLKRRAARFLKALLLSEHEPVEAVDRFYASMVRQAGVQLEVLRGQGYRLQPASRTWLLHHIPKLGDLIHG